MIKILMDSIPKLALFMLNLRSFSLMITNTRRTSIACKVTSALFSNKLFKTNSVVATTKRELRKPLHKLALLTLKTRNFSPMITNIKRTSIASTVTSTILKRKLKN